MWLEFICKLIEFVLVDVPFVFGPVYCIYKGERRINPIYRKQVKNGYLH